MGDIIPFVRAHVRNIMGHDTIYQWEKKGLFVPAGGTVVVPYDPMSVAEDSGRQLLVNDLNEARVNIRYEVMTRPGISVDANALPPEPKVEKPEAPKESRRERRNRKRDQKQQAAERAPIEPVPQPPPPKDIRNTGFIEGTIEASKPPIVTVFGDSWEKKGMASPRRRDVPAVDIFQLPTPTSVAGAADKKGK